MTNKDQEDHYKSTLNLVNIFVKSNQRKRINLLSDIESEVENIFLIGKKIFDDFDGYLSPEGGFFLWLDVDNGEKTALELWQTCGVRVLPGKYLAKELNGQSPGDRFIRVAMVSELEETKEGLKKIREFLN